jgi:Zn-dependent protease with chaperone function
MRSTTATVWIDRTIASRFAPWVAAALLFFFPIVLFWQMLPAAANWVAQHVPVRYELPLGEHVLQSPVLAIKASKLSKEYQTSYRQRVLKLAQLAEVQDVRVEFRAGWPNAYALPGNIMLLTDDLFNLMGSNQEHLVDAIVAHELGHMKRRHIARMLISQQLLTEVILKMNGQSGPTTQIAGLANGLFLSPHFSRQHEAQADEFAFDLMRSSGQSPKYFAIAMHKLQFWQSKNQLQQGTFTSSHPISNERIDAANLALDNSNVVAAFCKIQGKSLHCTIQQWDGARTIELNSVVQ